MKIWVTLLVILVVSACCKAQGDEEWEAIVITLSETTPSVEKVITADGTTGTTYELIIAPDTIKNWKGLYKPVMYVSADITDCPDSGNEEDGNENYVEIEALNSLDTLKTRIFCGNQSGVINAWNSSLENEGWEKIAVRVNGSGFDVTLRAELRITRKIFLDKEILEVDLNVAQGIEYWIEMEEEEGGEKNGAFLTMGITKMVCDYKRNNSLWINYVDSSGIGKNAEYCNKVENYKMGDQSARRSYFVGVNSFGRMKLRIIGNLTQLEVNVVLHKPHSSHSCPRGYDECDRSQYQYTCDKLRNVTICIPESKICDGRLSCPVSCEASEGTDLTWVGTWDEDDCRCTQLYDGCISDNCGYMVLYGSWWLFSVLFWIILTTCCVCGMTQLRRRRRLQVDGRRTNRVQFISTSTPAQIEAYKVSPPSYEEAVVQNRQ